MIPFEKALEQVQSHGPGPAESLVLPFQESLGHTLAEAVLAVAEAPPFSRSMMDGYGVRSEDTQNPPRTLTMVGESRAGSPFNGTLAAGECISILTGAVVPEGVDAVIPVEIAEVSGKEVTIPEAVSPGKHIANQGEDVRKGEVLLEPGQPLRPQEISVLAAQGKTQVRVFRKPRVAILTTGDELVPPATEPGPGQIRESNSYGIEAQVQRLGFEARRLERAGDDPEIIQAAIAAGLEQADCLVIVGGISVGKYDFVAGALGKLGVSNHFHGVAIKPGKPVWFGTLENKVIFGLPGNPVSAFVIFETIVAPALHKMNGRQAHLVLRQGIWKGGAIKANKRLQFVPAVLEEGMVLRALPWTSSGDFYELSRANVLAKIPPGAVPEEGTVVEFLSI